MPRACSFCRDPNHCKPRCDKYQFFFVEIQPILNQPWYASDKPKWCEFYVAKYIKWRKQTPAYQLSELEFQYDVGLFYTSYKTGWERMHKRRYMHFQANVIRQERRNQEDEEEDEEENSVPFELDESLKLDKSEPKCSCGICLSDEIPHSKMVKLSCNHEFCGECTMKMIEKKPRCAFCRAIVEKVYVNNQDYFETLTNK